MSIVSREYKDRMININYGRSQDLLETCEPLKEYAWLVEEIRNCKKGAGIEEAVSKAIEEMPKDFVIKAFLEAHKAEVKGMLLTEYNEAETMELFKEEGRAEGRAEALAALAALAKEGLILESVKKLCFFTDSA